MDIGIIARRYAKALIEYAVEQKSEDALYQEILMFIKNYQEIKQLPMVLDNPLVSPEQKINVICQAASTQASLVFRKFATLVVYHHRESIMPFIAHSFIGLYRKLKHISIGQLITAVPVADKEADRLEMWMESQAAESTDVILEKKVDPNILGGFIFEIDDYRLVPSNIELSDIKKLEKVKMELAKPRILSMLIWQTYWQPLAKVKFPIILKDKTKMGIYKITNIETNECYIGQAVDIYKRWS